jgi:hypothetical protein
MRVITKFIPVSCAFLIASLLPFAGWSQTQNSRPGQPGAINYVEGQSSIGNEQLGPNSAGSAQLQAGQTLNTQNGKVEILLVPGTFLRVDDNSSVKMINPGLADTEVEIEKGRAMVEGLDISKNNNIHVDEDGVKTKIVKNGLYGFDANEHTVRVFKGQAQVLENDKKVTLDKERELVLNTGAKPKAQNFDARKYEDDFFRWSALRSGYLSEASIDEASAYVNEGPGWFGLGWYWDPWFDCYTFIPGAGIFYSPFGWGFYSPIGVYRSPFYYGGYYGFGHPHRFGDFHYPYGHGIEPRGGFHGPVGGFHSGGFGGARGGGRR